MYKLDSKAQEAKREEIEIIKSALGTPAGAKLMELLEQRFQRGTLFSDDALRMARNTAKYDLVEEIKTLLEA